MSEPTNVPTLTRDEIAQRFILKITNAALNEWEKLPDSIASDVITSVIDVLNDELAAFDQSVTNRKGSQQLAREYRAATEQLAREYLARATN